MDKKAKIAFCFSGQARTLDETYPFFKKNLFDAAKEQGFCYDVFCAVEEDEDSYKVNLLCPTELIIIKKDAVEKEGIFKDSLSLVKNYRTLRNGGEKRWKQVLHQYYNISINFRQIKGKDFDLVVRLRFDCFLFNKLNFKTLIEDVKEGNVICNKFVTCSICGSTKPRKINDFFFFGNGNSMEVLGDILPNMETALIGLERNKKLDFIFVICDFYKKIAKFINSKIRLRVFPTTIIDYLTLKIDNIITPELIYYNHFLNEGIKIKTDNFSFILLRKNLKYSIINFDNKNKYEM